MVSVIKTSRQELNERFFRKDSNLIENANKTYLAFDKNTEKNAFTNIKVPDHSRVILQKRIKFIKNMDYINANWICDKTFIATQQPLNNTICDFYKMCIENDVKLIVNLTGKNNYIPQYGAQRGTKYDNIVVHNVEQIKTNNIIIRKLKLFYKDNIYNITHIQFLSWPDFGIPNDNDFMNLISIVKKYDHYNELPIVVHCRAGVGRTGVFIAVYSNLRYGIRGKTLDIEETIEQMRRDRDGMVQTLDQAEFAYNILLKLIQKKSTLNLSQATNCLKIIPSL